MGKASKTAVRVTRSQVEEDNEKPASEGDPRNALKQKEDKFSKPPAELFRGDLISAMKMGDSEYIDRADYFEIADQWKEEWQRPVQVPVNPSALPVPVAEPANLALTLRPSSFSLPPEKMLHLKSDDRYHQNIHFLCSTLIAADAALCKYNADEQDLTWLRLFNGKLLECDLPQMDVEVFERLIEAWEIECFQNMTKRLGLGNDEDDIVCDVCWSLESEESNEMVYCDRCDICVHQACYGIADIPDGAWLCRPCSLGLQPTCLFCNKTGGAFKPTKSGNRFGHVSCAIWVPEVGFGDAEKMEPIIDISKIPESRWLLVCSVCRESKGAAIQCSVSSCKTAFHVTCGFEASFEMQEVLVDDGDDVILKGYCKKHSAAMRDPNAPPVRKSTQKSRAAARLAAAEGLVVPSTGKPTKAEEMEARFYTFTSGPSVASRCSTHAELAEWVFNYWKAKRHSLGNRPLLPEVRAHAADKERLPYVVDNPIIAAVRRFIVLRQDLERARNLCYLLVRREKRKRDLLRTQVDTLKILPDALTNDTPGALKRSCADVISLMRTVAPVFADNNPLDDLISVLGASQVYSEDSSMGCLDETDRNFAKASRRNFRACVKEASKNNDRLVTRIRLPSEKGPAEIVASTSPIPKKGGRKANPKLEKIRLRLAASSPPRNSASSSGALFEGFCLAKPEPEMTMRGNLATSRKLPPVRQSFEENDEKESSSSDSSKSSSASESEHEMEEDDEKSAGKPSESSSSRATSSSTSNPSSSSSQRKKTPTESSSKSDNADESGSSSSSVASSESAESGSSSADGDDGDDDSAGESSDSSSSTAEKSAKVRKLSPSRRPKSDTKKKTKRKRKGDGKTSGRPKK